VPWPVPSRSRRFLPARRPWWHEVADRRRRHLRRLPRAVRVLRGPRDRDGASRPAV
ncbi:MAG: hypothetical protein AVDCRST_MAG36-690, partial [uncultured Nocardioidaceae bacterium]